MLQIKNIFPVFVLFAFFACSSPQEKKEHASATDSTRPVSIDSTSTKNAVDSSVKEKAQPQQEPEVIVTDSSNYSKNFILGLKEYHGFKKYLLKDSLLIMDDKDTVYFPKTPVMDRVITLSGEKNNLAILVTLKRINYTTIDYAVAISQPEKDPYYAEGKADIGSLFFLGDEVDVSDKTGLSYFATEFSDNASGDCSTHIRLGYEKGSGSGMLGKLIKNCNGKFRNIALDNFPTLTEN